jgi:hypothetical protein
MQIIDLCNTNNSILFVLVSNIFKFGELESHLISTRLDILSSRIGEKLMWFLSRWCSTYLMPDMDSDYHSHTTFSTLLARYAILTSFTHTLNSTYGNNESGQQITLFLLKKIITNLFNWQSEPDLATVCLYNTMLIFYRLRYNFSKFWYATSSLDNF